MITTRWTTFWGLVAAVTCDGWIARDGTISRTRRTQWGPWCTWATRLGKLCNGSWQNQFGLCSYPLSHLRWILALRSIVPLQTEIAESQEFPECSMDSWGASFLSLRTSLSLWPRRMCWTKGIQFRTSRQSTFRLQRSGRDVESECWDTESDFRWEVVQTTAWQRRTD